MESGRLVLFFSTAFALGALTCMAIAMATDYWIATSVDREAIRSSATSSSQTALLAEMADEPIFFTRYRGMFRTCYPGNETIWLANEANRVDQWCVLEAGLLAGRKSSTDNFGSDFQIRMHLLKAYFGLYIVGMTFTLLSVFPIMAACYNLQPKTLNLAALFAALGSFFTASSVAVFHGIVYMEDNTIEDGKFRANIKDDPYYRLLIDETNTFFGYSYILAWVGVFCGFVGALLLLCLASKVRAKQQPDDAKALTAFDDYTLSNNVNSPRKQDIAMQDYMAQQAAAASAYNSYAFAYPSLGYTRPGNVYQGEMINPRLYDYENYRV
ncbi:hypothetical protein CAPTEDRAFT_221665 [Capitella teleta]|uniref:Claudin n=1 Tax=Capitella teleta TaxID=283909 RepID=R7TPT5_CAPTE|nr:hypothetical protein CAPTEDRAFT_221665 [Capitella teleta]|eukprot:ELT93526.1 hypothetical protein CAPTEDRAFT_221665 [Capitella teleta]